MCYIRYKYLVSRRIYACCRLAGPLEQQPVPLLCKIVPAVSPVFGQNPCFQVYTMRHSGLHDWATHYWAGSDERSWSSYTASAALGVDIQPHNLPAAFESMSRDPARNKTLAENYLRMYAVHRNAHIPPIQFVKDFADIVVMNHEAYTHPDLVVEGPFPPLRWRAATGSALGEQPGREHSERGQVHGPSEFSAGPSNSSSASGRHGCGRYT